jgi:ketosteroid isomerase-like protein
MTRAALKNAEERLRGAILAGDVEALDALLSDRIIIVRPDGQVVQKEDDLDLYRSGRQRVMRYEPSKPLIELHGDDIGVVVLQVSIAGEMDTVPFAGSFRVTRTYAREHDAWRIVCEHASSAGHAR